MAKRYTDADHARCRSGCIDDSHEKINSPKGTWKCNFPLLLGRRLAGWFVGWSLGLSYPDMRGHREVTLPIGNLEKPAKYERIDVNFNRYTCAQLHFYFFLFFFAVR